MLARVAAPSRLGEIGDDRRRLDQPHRLDGQQVRDRPDPGRRRRAGPCPARSFLRARQRVDRRRGHRAAALAPAHRRSTGRARGDQRLLRFRRADEADRHADDRRPAAARRRRAFPAAGTTPSARCRWRRRRRRAAAPRARSPPPSASCASARRVPATAGSPSVQITSLSRGSRARVTPFDDHPRVAQDRRAGRSAAIAASRRLRREAEIGGDVDHAAGVDDPHRDALFLPAEAREIRLAPDDREGAAIDFRAVADVVAARRHGVAFLANAPATARYRAPAARLCKGSSPARPVDHQIIAAVARDERERRRRADGRSPSRSRRHAARPPPPRKRRRESDALRSAPRASPCAGGRARTGDDGEARIGGVDDEARGQRGGEVFRAAPIKARNDQARQGVRRMSAAEQRRAACARPTNRRRSTRPNGAAPTKEISRQQAESR